MKKLMYLALAFIAIATGFTACELNTGTIVSSQNKTLPIYHVGDSLFALQYEDYNFDSCRAYFDKRYYMEEAGVCSEVRFREFVGRNLDYSINRNACAIIKIDSNNAGRHASIGVIGCFKDFTYDMANNGILPDSMYDCLPGRTVDGINDCGVYVGVNVVPQRLDTYNDGYFCYEGVPDTAHAYNALYLPRFVLDNATCVIDAYRLICHRTWYFPHNYPDVTHSYQPFHWMIADKSSVMIIEFIDGKIVLYYTKQIDYPSYNTIMTNFSTQLAFDGKIDSLGTGYERWDILKNGYPKSWEPFDEQKMFDLMKKVWFSHSYTNECNLTHYDDFWFSELADTSRHADQWYGKGSSLVQKTGTMDSIARYKELWTKKDENWFTDTTKIWFTVHTSVYNIDKRKLYIIPHEGGKNGPNESPNNKIFEFSLYDNLTSHTKQKNKY